MDSRNANTVVLPRKRRINPLAVLQLIVRPRRRPQMAEGEAYSNVIVFKRRDTRTAHCVPRDPSPPNVA